MKQLLKWIWLLNKRLLKRPVFPILLLLIPVLVLGYSSIAGESGSLITVALAQDGEDALASQVITDLIENTQLINFLSCESTQEAEELVRRGKVDSAWIFPVGLNEKAAAFVSDPDPENAFVRVVEREDNVALLLAREKLSGKLYELCSRTVYLNFLRENIPEMRDASDEDLLALYDGTGITTQLFVLESTDGTATEIGQTNFLLTPLRGLLGVVIALCALAAAMYHIRDTQHGTFSWVALHLRPFAELGCQMVALVNLGIVSTVSLVFVGQTGTLLREIATILLYSLCCAAFAMMLRRLCGSMRALGTALPLLAVVMFLICPVFFDLSSFKVLQYLLPPTYYINTLTSDRYLLLMPIYTLACAAVYLVAGKVLRRE